MEAKGYQHCENKNNLWWWDQKVTNLKYRKPELINSKDTLESALNHLDSQKVNEGVVVLSNGNMLGTITTQILRNKLISGSLLSTDLVERCTTRILPKLDNNAILGRAFRIIENDRYAVVVETTGAGAGKIEKPVGIIFAEDLYAYTSKKQ
jgi:predicted transcriptional regulator